jgi:hypothetical protein
LELQNYETDITIPAGKTVILGTRAALRICNLTVNGTLLGSDNAFVNLFGALSGAGINAEGENWFYGVSGVSFTPYFWVWRSAEDKIGWVPTAVSVPTKQSIYDAVAFGVIELRPTATITLNESVDLPYLNYSGVTLTIADGKTVSIESAYLFYGASLNVLGTLTGKDTASVIHLVAGSSMTLNSNTYLGVSVDLGGVNQRFGKDIRRKFAWDGSNSWGTGTWIDFNYEGYPEVTSVYATLGTYSEALGFGLDVDRIAVYDYSFNEDRTLPIEYVEILNQCPIAAAVTLTVPSGGSLNIGYFSDAAPAEAVVLRGAGATSKIVVETGATVRYSEEGDTTAWTVGTYDWNSATVTWDREA